VAKPRRVGQVHPGIPSPIHPTVWCRACGATEGRLIELGFPEIARQIDGPPIVVITREIVCEECLARHDAMLAMMDIDPEGVVH
jgi:hypothetical protein